MHEPVTTVLLARNRDRRGLARMHAASAVAHVLLGLLIWLLPGSLGLGPRAIERDVMRISLGGAVGPNAGGMTSIGGRPIQEVVPTPQARPQPVRPPPAPAPVMTLPAARPSPRRPPARSKAQASPSQPPASGRRPAPGSSIAETGAEGTGFGLSTGGGGTGGFLDVGSFCCPEYIGTMQQLIRRNWDEKQPVGGESLVKFTIQRDGRITGVEVERSSGYAALDLASMRALLVTRQLPPLPTAFTEPVLVVHLNFQYRR
jgi:TonB family protein